MVAKCSRLGQQFAFSRPCRSWLPASSVDPCATPTNCLVCRWLPFFFVPCKSDISIRIVLYSTRAPLSISRDPSTADVPSFPMQQTMYLGEGGEIIASQHHFLDFLHETGLQTLKITSARCFSWKCERKKTRKKRKNTASFVASLGAGVQPRSTSQLF